MISQSAPIERQLFITEQRSVGETSVSFAARFYATMDSSEKTNEGRISPLTVEGMTPLEVLYRRLGLTQTQFCSELGVTRSSFHRWRVSGVASLDHVQAKKLDAMLRRVGLSIQDLPDDLKCYNPSENA